MVERKRQREAPETTPEQKRAMFFSQNYTDVAEQLRGKHIVVFDENGRPQRVIRIESTEGYPRSENERYPYKPILSMQPGEILGCEYKFRKSVLPLVSAWDEAVEQRGACVRIREASRFNQDTQKRYRFKNDKEVSDALGLGPNEKARLEFRDSTDRLFLVRTERKHESIDPKEAEQAIAELFRFEQ